MDNSTNLEEKQGKATETLDESLLKYFGLIGAEEKIVVLKEEAERNHIKERVLDYYGVPEDKEGVYGICGKPKNARSVMGLIKEYLPENEKSRVVISYDPDAECIVISRHQVNEWKS